jgi:hypothetical protein
VSNPSDPAREDGVQPPDPEPQPKDTAAAGPASHPDLTLMVSVIGVVMLIVAAGAFGFVRGTARANDVAASPREAAGASPSSSPSALAVEPLTPKVVVRHEFQPRRRNTPPFADSFNAALKPYLAGNYAAALDRFRELMVRYPAAPEPLVYAGVCELILGRPREAADYLKQAEPLTREVFLEDIAWYLALAHHAMGERSVEMELRTLCAVGGDHGARACAAVRELEPRTAPQ